MRCRAGCRTDRSVWCGLRGGENEGHGLKSVSPTMRLELGMSTRIFMGIVTLKAVSKSPSRAVPTLLPMQQAAVLDA